jgi:hypothetical protein
VKTKICKKCGVEKNICEFKVFNKVKGLTINECRQCKIEYLKKYNSETKKIRLEQKKEYRIKNSEKIKKNKKRYYIENKDKIRDYKRAWETEKRKNNIIFKIKQNVRHRIYIFLKRKKLFKFDKTFEMIGCTPEFLKEYIEKKFTGDMCWDKMGKEIHIDHIIPLSSAKTEEELYKLCHYTNLQPLWARENLSKGSKLL